MEYTALRDRMAPPWRRRRVYAAPNRRVAMRLLITSCKGVSNNHSTLGSNLVFSERQSIIIGDESFDGPIRPVMVGRSKRQCSVC